MISALKEIGHGIIHLFYPRLCEGCRKQLLGQEEVLCIGCALQLPVTDYHNVAGNETEQRFAGRIPFVRATSLAYFINEGLLQHLLHGLKYADKKEIGTYLGKRLGRELKKTDWMSTVDVVVPVPLHKVKQAKRGYNQSMLIAAGIQETTGVLAREDILIRVRNTESQTKKSRSERVRNMEDAFMIKQKGMLTGKHILLCDDVLTTGATLEACALALLADENLKISIATIGIAVS